MSGRLHGPHGEHDHSTRCAVPTVPEVPVRIYPTDPHNGLRRRDWTTVTVRDDRLKRRAPAVGVFLDGFRKVRPETTLALALRDAVMTAIAGHQAVTIYAHRVPDALACWLADAVLTDEGVTSVLVMRRRR